MLCVSLLLIPCYDGFNLSLVPSLFSRDHDDEESVFDAAKTLNKAKNLKGIGRVFKQIAQSARTSSGDNVDDFLGCIDIPLHVSYGKTVGLCMTS